MDEDKVRHQSKDWITERMISIVVGVSLIPTILTTIDALPTDTPSGLSALVDVLPYVFVAVILLGAVAWIGGSQ